ncbi:sulfite exporter TauE/SafE family protein [Leptospira noguchii]|uniref:Sulfite exporter TauE/SafE family protein n=4 Tax=Leptospira noguchii TaxID=28182 RepID=A0A9Q8RJ34_9LEPT|nr:sulfite exporter TauE/SafE family protein [Leptospira noguchii]TQE74358.1 sulfite exporter TauE/SafE family protein [Leptospira noguchii]UOG31763.1 sulfite exporter TauE/SafE family protein [Leptospira noguchii]UOG33125.1 sulfite exporter TauE/SafE family protein [Leptospira noguchii]UOG36729.1 sulfite exporter TauE/SafE family protein [Leptospira noguchii]UOG40374.1 sulfite exporter TauE/SafE family protein [Leptospira noguchii]
MQTELIITTISVAFLHGITSSLHCIGMCGPFAGTLNIVGEKGKFKMNLLYNLGRFISYSILGAILGFLGSGLNFAGSIFALQEFAAVFSGIFILAFGFRLFHNVSPERSGLYQKILNQFVSPLFVSIRKGEKLAITSLTFGIVTGLLPCAVLYPAFSLALATGNIGYGSIVMSAFFLGTFPALFIFGIGFKRILLRLPPNVIQLGGIIIIFLGISMIFFRMNHTQHDFQKIRWNSHHH